MQPLYPSAAVSTQLWERAQAADAAPSHSLQRELREAA